MVLPVLFYVDFESEDTWTCEHGGGCDGECGGYRDGCPCSSVGLGCDGVASSATSSNGAIMRLDP